MVEEADTRIDQPSCEFGDSDRIWYDIDIGYIPYSDSITNIMFNYMIPIFLSHFIGMGLLPCLFKYMKLVNAQYVNTKITSPDNGNLKNMTELMQSSVMFEEKKS